MIKSLKNIIFIVVLILVLGAQLAYLIMDRPEKMNKITDNKNKIAINEKKIIDLDKKLLQLPQTKNELIRIDKQKTALLEAVPISQNVTKEFIELFNIMNANSFSGIKIMQAASVPHEDELGVIIEKKHTLTYISTFTESKKFVENLNSSYQIINTEQFSIDNQIQTDEKQKEILSLWYGSQFNEVVTTTIVFSMFARPDDITKDDEIYLPGFNLFTQGKDVFLNVNDKAIDSIQSTPVVNTPIVTASEVPVTVNSEDSNEKFKLDIADSLTSGDTYKFLGPGRDPNSYAGLLSAVDTHITITIKNDGYYVVLEDENGNTKERSVSMDINDPTLSIFSKMRQITDVMPNVHIYIRNYTSKPIDVTLAGSLLENIHVYNEFDEKVLKGQTKGKVKLT